MIINHMIYQTYSMNEIPKTKVLLDLMYQHKPEISRHLQYEIRKNTQLRWAQVIPSD